MNTKTLLVLVVVTAVVAGAAALVTMSGRSGDEQKMPERLFEGLTDRVNDAAGLVIEKGKQRVEIRRGGDGWNVASQGGYPAKFEQVKQSIVSLAEMEPVEAKTANAELYSRIGVEAPGPESDSTLVRVEDASGQTLAELIVGDVAGGGGQRTFVRKPEAAQSWAVQGRHTFSADLMTWIEREIVRLERDRVQRVTIMHPDGETVVVSRPSPEATTFGVEDVPAGREPASASVGGTVGNVLSFLSLEGVKDESGAVFTASEPVVTMLETFDGLTVRVESWSVGTDRWVRLSASGSPVEADEPAGPPSSEVEAQAEEAADAGEDAQAEPSAVEVEAEELNQRWAGWVFKIPTYKADALTKRMEDLLKPLGEEGEAAGPTRPAG